VYSVGVGICKLLSDTDRMMSTAKVLWERTAKPIEMTIAEIEKTLGIKNLKIVKE
jgi:hypothetical protein